MNESKVLRVVGLSSSLPLDSANPLNPMNRRISLVVLNEKTERQIRGLPEEPMQEIENEADAAKALGIDGGAARRFGRAAPDGGRARRSASRRRPRSHPRLRRTSGSRSRRTAGAIRSSAHGLSSSGSHRSTCVAARRGRSPHDSSGGASDACRARR